MTWLHRYRLSSFVRDSVWLPPLLGILAGLLANQAAQLADPLFGWRTTGVAGSLSVLAALASAMLTFVVFVFSILLLVVQLASAQLTPRVIAHFYRNPVLKLSLTVFVFVFTFDLAVLARIDDSVPRLSGQLAAHSTVAAIGVFLYMIDKVGKGLRPISVLTAIGTTGLDVIAAVYPRRVSADWSATTPPAAMPSGECRRTVENLRRGVVLAFDPAGLLNPGKAVPALHRCAELGGMRVRGGALPHADLPRF